MVRTKHHRTCELVLPGKYQYFAGTGDSSTNEERREGIERKTRCTINVAHYKGTTKQTLISITEPREKIEEAITMITLNAKLSIE